jgi:cytoskeletal protein CcmA (bactofilin family)
MNVEKKMIRSDIPGHSALLTGTMPYNTAMSSGAAATAEERRLTVSRGIILDGQITDCQHLAIEGTVVAETLQTQRLDVLEHGTFTGLADVQDAVIAGRFDGKLVAKGRLTVKSTAHITGDIEYGALEIEAGSRIEARIAVCPAPAAPAAEKTAAVTAKSTTVAEAGEKIFDASNDEAEKAAVTEERPGTFRRAVGY